ncbi:MAG TPA: hypothetical protein VG276_13515 [Actinomycetes bacterium]|nr:hypothetical protein [Actinomycetes bacterium]
MSLAEPLTAAALGVALLGERLTAAGLPARPYWSPGGRCWQARQAPRVRWFPSLLPDAATATLSSGKPLGWWTAW